MSRHGSQHSQQPTAETALRVPPSERIEKSVDRGHADLGALQSQAGNQAVTNLLGSGTPLPTAVRHEMEQRFAADFRDVRIHDDPAAHAAAEALGAKAYTHGADIAFSAQRFAPGMRDGRELLAHELAHVVQQRRGGPAPALAADAPHERSADAAASQVSAGVPLVSVGGGTAVGVARDAEEPDKRPPKKRGTKAKPAKAAPTTTTPIADLGPLPQSKAAPELPHRFARTLDPSAEYWSRHDPDVSQMSLTELFDEANQIQEWLGRQTSSSVAGARMARARDAFAAEAQRRTKKAVAPAKRGRKPRAAKGAQATTDDPRPRFLRESASARTDDPAVLQREFDEISAYLQRSDVPAKDRKLLQLELANLSMPLMGSLRLRSQQRRAQVIERAITPRKSGGTFEDLNHIAQQVDNIRPLEGASGQNYLFDRTEMIVLTDDEVAAIRGNVDQVLEKTFSRNLDIRREAYGLREAMLKLNIEMPVRGWVVSLFTDDFDSDAFLDTLSDSARNMSEYIEKRKAGASFRSRALALEWDNAYARKARDMARANRDDIIDSTEDVIGGLEVAKTAGQFASTIAFGPAGSAIYGGGTQALTQGSEMVFGQRESFDPYAIARDTASGYVGGKITKGTMGLVGKSAPLVVKVPTFVVADRLGAAGTTATRMSLDQAVGRTDYSVSDFGGAIKRDVTDWKGAITSALLGKASHYAKSRPTTPPPPPAAKRQSATTTTEPQKGAQAASVASTANAQPGTAKDRFAGRRTPVAAPATLKDVESGKDVATKSGASRDKPGTARAGKPPVAAKRETPKRDVDDAASAKKPPKRSAPVAQRPSPDVAKPPPRPQDKTPGGAKDFSKIRPLSKEAQQANDPLVVVKVGSDNKGKYRPQTPADTKVGARQVVMPKSQADALGFVPQGQSFPTTITPRKVNGVQAESTGAGRRFAGADPDPRGRQPKKAHPIMGRATLHSGRMKTPKTIEKLENRRAGTFGKTIAADVKQAQGYNALLNAGERGLLRPGNISTGGVDAITVRIEGGKAKIFLNDFTTPGTGKGAKPSHANWRRELDSAVKGDRLNLGNDSANKAVREAIANGDVYVRTVRVVLPATATPGPRKGAGTAAPKLELGDPERVKP